MTDLITAERAREVLHGTTPGPWHVSNGEAIKVAAKDGSLATVTHIYLRGRRNTNEVEANAHLIAAAPDLARTVIAQDEELSRLRADLAKAVEALKPFADCAKHRCADDPAWKHHISVGIGVTIGDLRRVLGTLSEITK